MHTARRPSLFQLPPSLVKDKRPDTQKKTKKHGIKKKEKDNRIIYDWIAVV